MTDNIAKLEEIFRGIQATQTHIDALDKKSTARDALDKEQITRMEKSVTDAMESIQAEKQERKGLAESVKHIEANLLKSVGSVKSDEHADKLYGQQFARWMRKGKDIDESVVADMVGTLVSKSFYGADEDYIAHETKAMATSTNPDGGYLLHPQSSATMVKRIFETSPIRAVASTETTSTDSLEFVIDDNTGISGGWVTETASRAETGTPQIGKLVISVHEQYANPKVTQKLLDDAGFDIESWLADKTTDIFTRTENTAFVSGNGVTQPRGFASFGDWTAPGTYTRGAIERIKSTNATTLTGDGLKALQNSLKEVYQPRAVFMMKRDTFTTVMQLKDGQGRYLLDTNSLKAGDSKVLLGADVYFADDLAAIAASALPIAYGDFGTGYTIVDRIGIRVVRDVYTAKPYTQFYTTKRVGGSVTNYEAIKLQVISA